MGYHINLSYIPEKSVPAHFSIDLLKGGDIGRLQFFFSGKKTRKEVYMEEIESRHNSSTLYILPREGGGS